MNPKDIYLAALRGDRTDRVPLELSGFQYADRDELEAVQDKRQRRIAERIFDSIPYCVNLPPGLNRMLVTPDHRIHLRNTQQANGNTRINGTIDSPIGPLTFINEFDPRSRTSWHVKYPVENREDIKKIRSISWERPEHLSPAVAPDLPPSFSKRGILMTRLSSPFVCVAGMMKFEMFLELCLTDLPLIEELTAICHSRIMDSLNALLDCREIELFWLGGSEWLTPPMASPELYEALVQQQEKEIIALIHARSNAVVQIHCHGRIRKALPLMIERRADYTEPVESPPDGDITMADAKNQAEGRITLGGNIECRVLAMGTEEEVETAVVSAFEGGKERFVLRPTESSSPTIDDREYDNYMKLIDLWEELSPM